MSPSDDINKLLAELFAQPQQQVPPGNPIADYLGGQASQQRNLATVQSVGGAAAGLAGAYELMDNPVYGAMLMMLSSGQQFGAMKDDQDAKQLQRGSDMWANRFGSGDPNQGLPGTPSGPAWRRK